MLWYVLSNIFQFCICGILFKTQINKTMHYEQNSFIYQIYVRGGVSNFARPPIDQQTIFIIHIYVLPSNQHFKAFPVSKINSETSFLYLLFKENSNFIVLKPCKVISLSNFYDLHYDLYSFICLFEHLYTFITTIQIPRQVFCINFSRRIQIS